MTSPHLPMAPAERILSDGIELYTRRTGPLSLKETYRDRTVTAVCDECDRRQLRRHLVKKVKLGLTCCFNGCKPADAYLAAEAKVDASIAALNLPHETLRSKVEKWTAANGRPELAPPAPPPSGFVLKSCRCCGRDFTHEAWLKLKLLEVKETTEDGVVELHDMRNCECGSTLLLVSEREKGTGIYYRGGGR